MTPTAILYFSSTTTNAITTITNNNLSAYIANTSVVNSAFFTIRRIVLPTISAEPYRKVIIAILFVRRIISLSSSPSVSLSDLTATVVAYFKLSTGSTEREAKRIVDSIRHALSHVDNLQGVGFLDSSGKPALVSYLDNNAVDIALFTFRSSCNM